MYTIKQFSNGETVMVNLLFCFFHWPVNLSDRPVHDTTNSDLKKNYVPEKIGFQWF